MPAPISSITAVAPEIIRPGVAATGKPGEFLNVFQDAIRNVESLQTTATQKVEDFLSGESDELHSTVLSTQRAELAFDMLLQVRNKVVTAYQQIMGMQM
ncbi:MAG: flagellar hook-basal body complex protein FliE [Bryobacteraceae bacterium]